MFRNINYFFLVSALTIALLGIVTLISTTITSNGDIQLGGIVSKQIAFVSIGFILYFVISQIDITYTKHLQFVAIMYVGVVVLLIATVLWGPQINNVKRWLIISGVQIQASEFAKILVVIMSASIMQLKYKYNEWLLATISLILVLPIVALVFIQPHGAMSLIILLIWFIVVFTTLDNQLRNMLLLLIVVLLGAGIILLTVKLFTYGIIAIVSSLILFIFGMYSEAKWQKFFLMALLIGVSLGVVGGFSWDSILKDYQRDRIEAFFNPDEVDPNKKFNVDQSKIAIGSGGIFGKGFGYGTQSRLQFLPEHQTDFIFATYAEQFGLFGGLLLIAIYIYLINRTLVLSSSMETDMFGSILAFGLGFKLLIEVFINIGTNTGTIPATGIPLPLMSAGGSITIATFITLGIIQSLMNHKTNQPSSSDLVDNGDLLL